MRYLIVNGDDFGLSRGVTRGILDAQRHGILTSTSLMVNRPAAAAAAVLARHAPALSVGLHLELDDAPDPRTPVAEQLARFERLTGRPPTHLDSHHDTHRRPDVLPAVLEQAGRLGIPVRGHSGVASVHQFYGQWGGEAHPEQVSTASLIAMLESGIGEGITELICHPGHVDDELASSYAIERDVELRTLCDPLARAAIERAGIRLVGFRDVPALLRSARTPEHAAVRQANP